MNAPIGQKDRPYTGVRTVFNADTTTISMGAPCHLEWSTTVPNGVKNLSSGSAAKCTAFFMGIAVADIPAGNYGDVVSAGFCNIVKVVRMTRAASTDSWNSYTALAVGDYFTLDTVNNAAARSGAGAAAAAPNMLVALESAASGASSDSATSDTRTIITSNIRMLVRAL